MDSDGRPETELIHMQNASVRRPKCPVDRLSAEKMWARNGRGPPLKWVVEEEGKREGGRERVRRVGGADECVEVGGSRDH